MNDMLAAKVDHSMSDLTGSMNAASGSVNSLPAGMLVLVVLAMRMGMLMMTNLAVRQALICATALSKRLPTYL